MSKDQIWCPVCLEFHPHVKQAEYDELLAASSKLEEALEGKEAWFHDSQVARRMLEEAQSRLNGGIEILERWKAAADPRANDWSNLAEGVLLVLRGDVVETPSRKTEPN